MSREEIQGPMHDAGVPEMLDAAAFDAAFGQGEALTPVFDDAGHVDEGTVHAWLDGAFDAKGAAAVERHVTACASCTTVVAEARGLLAGSARILGALDGAARGVVPAADAVRTARRIGTTPKGWGGRWRQTVAALLMVGVGVVAVRANRGTAGAGKAGTATAEALTTGAVTTGAVTTTTADTAGTTSSGASLAAGTAGTAGSGASLAAGAAGTAGKVLADRALAGTTLAETTPKETARVGTAAAPSAAAAAPSSAPARASAAAPASAPAPVVAANVASKAK